MALTDSERMQMTTLALMKYSVVLSGGGTVNNFVYMPMVGSYSVDAYFVSDITIAEVIAL
jgi:hypothetical protein